MFLSALEIDRSEGATIAPALQQASNIMKDNFALKAEAQAELSSVKSEFIGVFIILVLIGWLIIQAPTPPGTPSVWTTPAGIVVAIACVANAGLGWLRLRLLISKIEKETQ